MREEERVVGRNHAFHDYFDTGRGGVGHPEAAAILYGAELIYTGLVEVKETIDDLRVALNVINATLRDTYLHGANHTEQGDGANP